MTAGTGSPREQLARTLGDLQREQSELLGRLSTAAEAEHEARVAALVSDPSKRSASAGAASRVRKLGEQHRRDEARLSNVEAELAAAAKALSLLDEREAVEAHRSRTRASQALLRREQAELDVLRAIAEQFVAEFATYEALSVERIREFGGSDDPELQPAVPLQASPDDLFAFLSREQAPETVEEPGTFPRAPAQDKVVPVPRSDPRWAARAAVTR